MILFADSENFTSITAVHLMRYLLKHKQTENQKATGDWNPQKFAGPETS